jgi:CubicO group peptidase (beta-lactamase class C family)
MIDELLQREIDVGSFAGASYAIGSLDGIERTGAVGRAVSVPLRLRASVDTIYDCASITKALVTTTLVLQQGLLEESFHGFPVRSLLTHTSGLRAWLPLYAFDDPLRAILERGPEYEPGRRVVYSDLNFILLWMMLGRDEYLRLARERIFKGLDGEAMFNPGPLLRPRIAATEWGQRFEARMCADRAMPVHGLREGLMWGETNDGNSFHVGGGTAGNAGLFATARAVFGIAQAFARNELAEIATRNYTAGLDENRGLGWQLASPTNEATSMLSPRAFGHMGFTGTSVWIDPEYDRIMVLLTNRIHPCAAPIAMGRIRGELHRMALQVNR